jgi:hypothetical protein
MKSVDTEVFAIGSGSRMERVAGPMVALLLCLPVRVVRGPGGGRLGEY